MQTSLVLHHPQRPLVTHKNSWAQLCVNILAISAKNKVQLN